MDLFFLKTTLRRAWERKKTMIFFGILCLVFTVLGLCFVNSAAVYEYHLYVCEGFLTDVCFSETNVFVIFLERTGGCALLLALVLVGGFHPAALLLSVAVLVYRAFTFGGSMYVFFDYFGLSGAMVVLILYLPIHLMTDAVLAIAATLSCERAFGFRFCASDLRELLFDFLVLLLMTAAVYLAEAFLLLALFHPIGKIL